MRWRPYKVKGATQNYSITRKLKNEGKIDDKFEIMINSLGLEEVIAVKLESASKAIGGKLYGLPLWSSLTDLCKDALLKYAYSVAKTRVEACRFVGLSPIRFSKMLTRHQIKEYFAEMEKDLDK